MNKGYDQAPGAQTINQLFSVDSSNLVGGIEVSPIDLNETYNQVEVAYPNTNIKDQTDYQIIDLYVEDPQLLSANEAVNRLNLTLPYVNNAVQAKYLGARRLYQSREDLVIAFRLDFSGIQIEAGDVIRVTHEVYGWTDKLFRVSSVAEEKDTSGNLYAAIQAFEYSNDIYDDIIEDYVPAFNTGLKDPNVISPPCDPTITNFTDSNALVTGFDVTTCVLEEGLVLYMDFNYGNTSNVLEHRLYRTVEQSNGTPFINSPDVANANVTPVSITVNDLPSANYYWSITARNNTAGKRSGNSTVLNWAGANIQPYNPNSNTGGISGGQVKSNTLTLTQMEPGLSEYKLGTTAWSTRISNTTILPIDISTGFNTPTFLYGTDVPANEYFPFYQNTSTTAMGYVANSTAAWTPGFAGLLNINNGDDNWWIAGMTPFTAPGAQFTLRNRTTLTLVANANTTCQVAFFRLSQPGNIIAAGTFFSTIELLANKPIKFYGEQYSVGSGANAAGVLIRNMVANTELICVEGRVDVLQTK